MTFDGIGSAEFAIWLLGGVGVAIAIVVVALRHRASTSPKKKRLGSVATDTLPPTVLDSIRQFLPVPVPDELTVEYRENGTPKEYLFRVDRGDEQFLVEVNLKGDPPRVRQIEFNHEERISHRRRRGVEEIELAAVPQLVRDTAEREMRWSGRTIDSIHRASRGTVLDQQGYKLEGRTGDWEFEIGVLETGAVLQVEFTDKTPLS